MKGTKLESVALEKINIQDRFWNRYIDLVREVLIPYQWDILNDRLEDAETSHCIENLKIAAGESKGKFQGAVFQDTDLAKWLEAAAYTLAVHRDPNLERLVDETIDLIGKAQCEDGYFNTYFTIMAPELRWTNLKEGHELYTAGHMTEAAVAYYEATGKTKFLEIMEKFVDLICDTFGPEEGKCHGYPGHQEIELALVRLYRATGKVKYLELAKYFIDARGVGENYFLKEAKRPLYKQIFPEFAGYDTKYSQSHLPVREQKTAEGHAVRAVYMYCAMADLAALYEDEELLEACKTLWEDMTKKRMYITGGIGSSGLLERFTTDYDLPNNCNYSETCASIGLALFGKRMAQITKDASYMDVVERALYNTVLAGIAQDGRSFFYVNPLEVWPDNCMPRTSKEHVMPVRQKWFGVACCPPNIARTLASLGQYIYFTEPGRIYVNLYISNETQVDDKIRISVKSDLTNTGHIELKMENKGTEPADLALRIPDYVSDWTLLRNGEAVTERRVEKGYLILEGMEPGETQLVIDFAVPARFVRANPKVREDSGKVAIVKGPLVYCLEETDNGGNLPAIFVSTAQELQEQYEEELLGGVTTIQLRGRRMDESAWDEEKLYAETSPVFEEVQLKAVPYHAWDNRKTGEMLVWMKEWFS